ncbi:acyltransferase family protein [Dyadobacter tibetensis]|uniref:acyltransferase family protein n=1 Tax=Dyadobacter tibetensis TaxID=1211851 RepID=UPI000471F407|nr:acyltransferase [Dyadobacter tibetensis]
MSAEKKRYFPNLNGVRCIAALLVVFHHIEQAKHALNIPNIYDSAIIKHAGRLGVGLFFVLSGFLITYLLLDEKARFGNIDAKKFYLRRVFRIWPIYFLMILLSLFWFPHLALLEYPGIDNTLQQYYPERLALLLLVLPNYAFVLYDLPYWCAQAWSIGVEEQFYYLWPWLIKYPKRKILILLLFLAATALLLWIGIHFRGDIPVSEKLRIIGTFVGQFRIQTMALGGGCAWLVFHNKEKILNILFRKDSQLLVYTLLLVLFFSGLHFTGFLEVYALFFGFFVLNVSCNPDTIIHLENPVVKYIGKISYGLYLYHVAVLVLLMNLLERYFPTLEGSFYHIILYVFTVLLSVGVSALSFNYFEKPLLAYKDKRFGR